MSRIARLAALLEEPLLVAGPPYVLGGQANVRYLTGLQSSNAAVLVEPDGGATLYTDFRYANRARALEGFEVVEAARGLIPAIGELLAGRRILFDEQNLPHALYRALVDAGVDAQATSGEVEALRAVKDEAEIAAVRRASALSDEIFEALSKERFTGRSEKELAWWVEKSFREAGAEGVSFEAIVGAGGTAASPHAVPADVPIEARRSRHDRRRLRPRRLLLRLHADVRRRRRVRAAAGAPRALPRGPARRSRRGRTRRPRARRGRRLAYADRGGRALGWAYGHGMGHRWDSRSMRRPRCAPSRRMCSWPEMSSRSSPGSICRTKERASGSEDLVS